MTGNTLAELRMARTPGGTPGQNTQIEQARAVAEVQAAIIVARQFPRDTQRARDQMQDSCRQMGLAERAFYRFPRAGGAVEGPTVHLARELARCWGNIQYGHIELARDDVAGMSEMQAFAWDVETNARSSLGFQVPHVRDTRDGAVPLMDARDVYENNANNGARRLREVILSILPPWFVEDAKGLCRQTLADGGGKPLPQRVAECVAGFEALGIARERVEAKVGKPSGEWTPFDVGQLGVTWRSIQNREVNIDDEFPVTRVTGDEIIGRASKRSQGGAPSTDAGKPAEPGSGGQS